ncbi:MAG TPA: hypothetical protein GX716_01250, partial [Firmicutes bacterium]|nr:hypothetical protein [Candidatus Fermentithermobacillaceae bacterium]
MSKSRSIYISTSRSFFRIFLTLFLALALLLPAAGRVLAAAASQEEVKDEAAHEFQVPAAEKVFMEILLAVKDL